MDESLFDRMTRLAGSSRRSTVRTLLAGTTLAAAGSLMIGSESQARKKCKKRKPCPTCETCPNCPECPVCEPLDQGAQCASNADCCTNETNNICGFRTGNGPICCGGLDATCTVDDDCCNGFTCLDGVICKPFTTCTP